MLEASGKIDVAEVYSNAEVFIEKCDLSKIQIVLMDVHMPGMDGIKATEILKLKYPKLKVILLTMQRGTRFMQRAEKLGVEGYVLKSVAPNELIDILFRIQNGEIYYDPQITNFKQEDDIHLKSTLTINENNEELLSEREKEILVLVCKEYSSSQIAEKLFISVGTVDTHRKNILIKLGVTNTVGLVKYALKNGLLID